MVKHDPLRMIHRMSESEYVARVDAMIGLCDHCGAEREQTEPDATGYFCDECDRETVFGCEWLLMSGRIEFTGTAADPDS